MGFAVRSGAFYLHRMTFVNEEGRTQDGTGGNISMMQRKRKTEVETPLEKYFLKYVTVTDVCSQVWCEQQMVYKMEQPAIVKPERAAAMSEGSSIHLARELEVHDIVTVTTQTREDSWAIKCLNILSMIPVLQSAYCIQQFASEEKKKNSSSLCSPLKTISVYVTNK
ncbi:unnamed protein product [Ranitomeya imitator]|uniref:Vitellogenin n=1 Tax=Ranitomeya imitator TaxID=111125 RepID=A0ABN9L293_9NEOB|nr:unnamed protein product [Ranitomeya imitator]